MQKSFIYIYQKMILHKYSKNYKCNKLYININSGVEVYQVRQYSIHLHT
jgi:hypothetical protein